MKDTGLSIIAIIVGLPAALWIKGAYNWIMTGNSKLGTVAEYFGWSPEATNVWLFNKVMYWFLDSYMMEMLPVAFMCAFMLLVLVNALVSKLVSTKES